MKGRKLLVSLLTAVALIAVMAVPAMAADTQDVTASVTVTEYISITVTDEAPAGITFGEVNPNTNDNPDLTTAGLSETNPSVTVNVENETNVSVDLKISGTNFSGGLAVTNAKYSTTYTGGKTAMSTTPTKFAGPLSAGGSQMLWHWLDVPSGTAAGTQTSTFTYQAVKA